MTESSSHSEDPDNHGNGIPIPESVTVAGESTHYGGKGRPSYLNCNSGDEAFTAARPSVIIQLQKSLMHYNCIKLIKQAPL